MKGVALVLTGAQVLRGDGFCDGALGIRDGRITDATGVGSGPVRRLDLAGCLVLPGIVDIHGDGFERHLAPRRGAQRDLAAGLRATESELAANGITTAHLAQFWSWEGGMRSPGFALALLAALDGFRSLGTDMRVQLRLETHLLDDYTAFEAAVAAHGVRHVVFNDHLPHAALTAGRRPPRLTGQALKSGRSPEAHLALLQALHGRSAAVPGALAGLAARLRARGVALGSHDDADAAARAEARGMGVTLSEFPQTEAAARAARAGGDAIVLGSPNVVRGGSHSGNVSARALIDAGLCDALASDYHYPAPLQAALALGETIGLPRAWALVSGGPARLCGYADRGRLGPGLRADLVVLDPERRVCLTLAAGRVTHAAGRGAEALLAA